MEELDEERPSWLHESCPRWCTRVHLEDDHPDDRVHEADAILVAAITAAGDVPMVAAHPFSLDLAVRRTRRVDDTLEWVLIEATESPQPRLRVTSESARNLARAIGRQSHGR